MPIVARQNRCEVQQKYFATSEISMENLQARPPRILHAANKLMH